MQTSTIKFSQIEDRINAEYYKPEYLRGFLVLERYKMVKRIKDLLNEMIYGTSENIKYVDRGTPLLRITDFDETFDAIDANNLKFVPEYQADSIFKKYKLREGNLLFSRSGTIGLVAYITKEFAGSIFGSYFIKLSPKRESINSIYLTVFLNSYFGRLQSERMKIGAVQTNIALPQISSILVPIPPQSFQQKIEEMVKEAERKRKLADERYKEAEEILNKELGLEDLDLSTQKTFETKFSKTEDRFDPEYYQPKYKRIIQLLKSRERRNKFELYDLDEILTVKRGSLIDNGYYWSIGIPYIRIKDLTPHGITSNNFVYINKFQAKIGEYETIREGDQLLTVIGATVGKICHVPKEFEGSFFSNNISRLRLKKEFSFRIDTIYLESVLRSIVCQTQILRNATQTAQPKLNDAEVRNMIVPILPKTTQQKISSLIQESMELHKGARKLIDRAKKEVEAMVEKK